MSVFANCWPVILEHEVGPLRATGGYVNDPKDAGGVTKWGWSLRTFQTLPLLDADLNHDGHIDAADVVAMDESQAMALYEKEFWVKYGYGNIQLQTTANKVCDLAVNMGSVQAGRLVQRALMCSVRGLVMTDDGILGPSSMKAINDCPGDVLVAAIRAQAEGYYRGIVMRTADLSKFLDGWVRRARY